MRHALMIALALVLAQGSALADGMPDVPPLPANSCPAPTDSKEYKELQSALTSSQQDVDDLLAHPCDPSVVKKVCERHPDSPGCKTQAPPPAVTPHVTTTHKTHVDKPKPKTPDPDYFTVDKVDVGGRNCVKFTKWTDRNRNGKFDDGEATQIDKVCDGKDGASGKNGHTSYLMTGSHFDAGAAKTWCTDTGGTWIDGYVDLNDNGKLDKGESVAHVGATCDAPVIALRKGHDGLDGRPGHDGTTVAFGSLVTGDLFYTDGAPKIRSSSFGLQLMLEHDWAEASVGGGWSPGIDHGSVLEADFAAYLLWNRVGPRLGAELVYADVNAHNQAKYQLLVATPGIAVRILDGRHWKMRAETHFGFGKEGTYSNFHTTEDIGGSVSLSYGF